MSKGLAVSIERKKFIVNGDSLEVFSGIRFEIGPSEFAVLLGPSGCGKTTLLRLILGLDNDYEGTIELDGRLISGPGLDRGIVFQEPRLIPWMSVQDNIAFALPHFKSTGGNDDDQVSHLITLTGLSGFENAWPNQLSGGMSQRVAIARALVNVPNLLLMDEPLGALDSHTRMRLQRELARIHDQESITTLMVTHDVDEAVFLGDKIIVLTDRVAEISKVFAVDLSKPRDRVGRAFVQLRSQVLAVLNE